jgi:hypothetical protein
MQKLILVYGVIAGLVIIGGMVLSLELGVASMWLGYLIMFIVFSTIFVAVKQYRDDRLGGVIRFGTGFGLGLGITILASLIYVFVWELYLMSTDYTFIDTYINSIMEGQKAAGASPEDLAATSKAMESLREIYADPLKRLPMTFVEIFPVGLLISLIAAFILKSNKSLATA